MQSVIKNISLELLNYIKSKYNLDTDTINLVFQNTNKDHNGDVTLMVFPLIKHIKENPEKLAQELGDVLLQSPSIESFNVVKGFLNLNFSLQAWNQIVQNILTIEKVAQPEKIVLEYCGPNTNKPLHIGHLRNMFLGFSMSRILEEYGQIVHKVNIFNDRGIAICKSMIAYKLYGNGTTPDETGKKGDFFVGDYYVKFNEVYKSEIEKLISEGIEPKQAERQAPIFLQAQEMLLKWEEGDEETVALWNLMNSWFYSGIRITYNFLGIEFEKEYFESQVYKKGKEIIDKGYEKGVFEKDENGAYFIDLTSQGLDKKIVQRADGTSLYITQDIALVKERYLEYHMDKMIYVVGDEQNYHFNVLQKINEALNEDFSKSIYHLSYGMVTAKDGSKFKSREGTAADADDIVNSVIEEAKLQTQESGKASFFSEEELHKLSQIIGIGALKYVMLRVHPKKSIPFDPKETVDLHGDTGAFIQYSFVRTNAILKKSNYVFSDSNVKFETLEAEEKELLMHIAGFNKALSNAATQYDPSEIAQFVLQLAKLFNRFYTQHSILNHENESIKKQRLYLTYLAHDFIKKSLFLLGIESPERM